MTQWFNSAARPVLRKKKTDHIAPLICSPHWLLVFRHIAPVLHVVQQQTTSCLGRRIQGHVQFTLQIPWSTFGSRSFPVFGPSTRNKLPSPDLPVSSFVSMCVCVCVFVCVCVCACMHICMRTCVRVCTVHAFVSGVLFGMSFGFCN